MRCKHVCLIISGDKAKLPLIIVNWSFVERTNVTFITLISTIESCGKNLVTVLNPGLSSFMVLFVETINNIGRVPALSKSYRFVIMVKISTNTCPGVYKMTCLVVFIKLSFLFTLIKVSINRRQWQSIFYLFLELSFQPLKLTAKAVKIFRILTLPEF